MTKQAIRLKPIGNRPMTISLTEILSAITESKSLLWMILFLDGAPLFGQEKKALNECKKINQSSNGTLVTKSELQELSGLFSQIYETIVLASKDPRKLYRYPQEEAMYNTCEIVIELIDCAFWEIYTDDPSILQQLKSRFLNIAQCEDI